MNSLNLNGRIFTWDVPLVMGILNVTPDSFFDGGNFFTLNEALKKAERMLANGADWIDIGGFSSRPGAEMITEAEEIKRIIGVVTEVKKQFPKAVISVDTWRRKVAEKAIEAGASIINDISAGALDKTMFDYIGESNVPYVMMHMRGTPQTMQTLTAYENIRSEISDFFKDRINTLHQKGASNILIDPGFGFAKTTVQNYVLLQHLDFFKQLKKPILCGISRKSMIYTPLNITPKEALNGTTALHMAALLKGANILRVHDVKEAVEVVKLWKMIMGGEI